jgi:proline iminopeptidase
MKLSLKTVVCALAIVATSNTPLLGDTLRTLYPEIEPYQTGMLAVGDNHTLYWEESGKPDGKPVVFLHGGPGGGTEPSNRSFFDPTRYRIILFDQRGSGKSLPFSSLENNTTWHLVEDIERLRSHLNIDRWVVFGGSWGTTLALSYAIKHPESVQGLILRGIFLCRPQEERWYYQEGASYIFPDLWEAYKAPIPEDERANFIAAYYKRLTSANVAVRQEAAHAWSNWEGGTSKLHFDREYAESFSGENFADAFARIECHYFVNNAFFKTENWILENVDKIRSIPGVIVQGRYDVVCPMASAWDLHRAWPEATLEIVEDRGHSATEVGITDALIRATDLFAK